MAGLGNSDYPYGVDGRSKRGPLLAAAVLSVAVCVGLALNARAQRSSTPANVVLHEDLRPPADSNAARRAQALLGPEPSAGQNPSAFAAGQKLLPEPNDGRTPGLEEPVHGSNGFAADRQTEWDPDRQTGPDGTLRYIEVFNPSVLPFKRMMALDGVRSDFSVYTRKSSLSDVPVGGKANRSRDKFWASMVVDLRRGQDVPIPSVAPDMRILSYEITPFTNISFAKDEADNFYVRSEETGVSGRFRLVFLADASAEYFAPKIDPKIRIRDIPRSKVPDLPANVAESAARAAAQLRLHRGMRLKDALDKMAMYFRSFEAKTPPPPKENIFWDLFTSQAGVCRHRSFVFVVVAQQLGIPARYVANEAHAWVEVWIPQNGWARFDLGGAAMTLQVDNASGKTMHKPRGEDPFAKPQAYEENYTRLEGDVQGLSPTQMAEAKDTGGQGQGEADALGNNATGEASQNGEGEGAGEEPGDGEPDTRDLSEEFRPGPGKSLPEVPASMMANKKPVQVDVVSADASGFRGESITVAGQVRSAGAGVESLRVDIYLALAGRDGDDAERLGETVTDADGNFSVVLNLPQP